MEEHANFKWLPNNLIYKSSRRGDTGSGSDKYDDNINTWNMVLKIIINVFRQKETTIRIWSKEARNK